MQTIKHPPLLGLGLVSWGGGGYSPSYLFLSLSTLSSVEVAKLKNVVSVRPYFSTIEDWKKRPCKIKIGVAGKSRYEPVHL